MTESAVLRYQKEISARATNRIVIVQILFVGMDSKNPMPLFFCSDPILSTHVIFLRARKQSVRGAREWTQSGSKNVYPQPRPFCVLARSYPRAKIKGLNRLFELFRAGAGVNCVPISLKVCREYNVKLTHKEEVRGGSTSGTHII